jgi:hypothetical protein
MASSYGTSVFSKGTVWKDFQNLTNEEFTKKYKPAKTGRKSFDVTEMQRLLTLVTTKSTAASVGFVVRHAVDLYNADSYRQGRNQRTTTTAVYNAIRANRLTL